MKLTKIFATALLLSLPFLSLAQTAGSDPLQVQQVKDENQETFTVVEKMPEFPGGQEGLMKYLSQSIVYPSAATETGTSGTVYVQFVIDTDGSVINSKILRGIHPDCDAEALRAVNSMPKWKPGEQDGKMVKVVYNMPIRFVLHDSPPSKRAR